MRNSPLGRILRLGRILCVANQKGGVGKTTTSANLAAGLAKAGLRTLLVDLDPQCNATTGFGVTPAATHPLVSEVPLSESIVETAIANLSILPGSRSVRDVERIAAQSRSGSAVLESHLARGLNAWDYCLIDCPPSVGELTRTALAGSTEVLMPIQCEYFALEGLSLILQTIQLVQKSMNRNLRISGILFTMYDSRTRLAQDVVQQVSGYFGDKVYSTIIPRNVRLSEAPSHGVPVCLYDAACIGARSYEKLAKEVLDRG